MPTVPCNWQDQLKQFCLSTKRGLPHYNTFSDLRGGRTAWSCSVTVQGQTFPARYWWSGEHLNNAQEDAAEVALKHFNPALPSTGMQGYWERRS